LIEGCPEELVAETEHRKNERVAAQWTRRLGWFTAVAEAARLAGCSRQRLHEACRSYAEFSIRNAARRGCSLGPYDGTLSDQMQMRRWRRAEAKPMSRDLTAPRAEYLARVWGRLVAGYDRARDEAERERAADQARLVAGRIRLPADRRRGIVRRTIGIRSGSWRNSSPARRRGSGSSRGCVS
jgi:hypothetical protein